MESGIREKKSAKIKLQVLEVTLRLLGKQSFKELYVDQICEEVRISKVTFFKYFPQKEDILLYFSRVWCLENIIKISQKPEGLPRVKAVFEAMGNTYDKYPGLILSLISYLTSNTKPYSPFAFRPIERQLKFPEIENVLDYELLSMPQMFEKYLLEAVFLNQIKGNSDTKELSHLFLSTLYGSIVTGHLRQVDSVSLLMKRNVDILIKGLNS